MFKEIKKEVKEAYRIKLEKYKNAVDDLSMSERAKLYRMLWDEAVAETSFSKYTAECCRKNTLINEGGC